MHHDLGGTNGTPARWLHNKITIPVDYTSQGFSMVFTVDATDGTSIGLDDIMVQQCVDKNESLKGNLPPLEFRAANGCRHHPV